MQNKVSCPQCGSYKNVSDFALRVGFAVVLCFFIISAPIGILILLFAFCKKGRKKFTCLDCHFKFEKDAKKL